jgi:hypothetical protein
VQSERFDKPLRKQYSKIDHGTTWEVWLDAPDIVGEFCSFETIMAENTAYKSLRFRCGRKQDTTVVIVAQIYLRFSDVKRTPGLVPHCSVTWL